MDNREKVLPYHIIRSAKEEIKINLLGKYVPEEFWGNYGTFYDRTFVNEKKEYILEGEGSIRINTDALISRMAMIQPKTVLEVGCGFGRCLPFVQENIKLAERIVGLEFSPTMIERSKIFLKEYLSNKISIIQGDARNIPFEDREFELTYTHVCLTHIPPEFIPRVTSEIARVTKDYIIHIERFAFPYEHPNPHRWSHMLVPYYLDLDWEVVEFDALTEFPLHHTKVIILRRR